MFTLKISKLLMSVFNDFKCGTLSAWSLLFREVVLFATSWIQKNNFNHKIQKKVTYNI